MTVAEISGQISEIRARLAQMVPPQTTSADSGVSFASALSGATTAATTGTSAAAATTATTDGTGVTGDDVVQAALQYKGVPYVLGGESKSGIDCSGLVQSAFKDVGVSVPRLVHEQQTIGTKVDSLKDAKPGDLIVLNGGDHVAIWMGNDTVIHAPYPGRTVSVQKAWFDDADVTAIRRVVPATDDATSAATAPTTGATTTATAGTTSALGASTTATGAAGSVSSATSAQAAAMLAMFGGGSNSSSSSTSLTGSGSSDSLSALLASIGGTASGTTASGTTAQQLLSARAALLSTEA